MTGCEGVTPDPSRKSQSLRWYVDLLRHRVAEPVREPDSTDPRLTGRCQRLIVELGAEVAGVNIRDPLAPVSLCSKELPRELVERSGVGSGNFDRAVDRGRNRKIGKRRGDVIRRDRLEQGRRQPDSVAIGAGFDDAADEFEKLGGAENGVGPPGRLDQVFLRL